MTESVIIGESHTACIANAAEGHPSLASEITVYRLQSSKRKSDKDSISLDSAEEILKNSSQNTTAFIYLMGTFHNIVGLLKTAPEFDFLIDEEDDGYFGNSVIIPNQAIRSMFIDHVGRAASILKLIRAAPGKVYLLGTPPPKRSNDYIISKFQAMLKKDYHGKDAQKVGVNRPELRLKLWKIEQDVLRTWCTQNSIIYLPSPSAACDRDGFLLPEFYADDATHANADYGRLWIETIRTLTSNE